nr:tetraspanin-2 [Quercus suber]
MGVSNNITATLNFIAFLASIPIIASGIWLASKPDNECTHYFRWPVVILGFLILLVSLAGFVGAYRNKQGLLAFYLICMAILIALLLILLVFAFTVTRPDGSYSVPGRGYKEYRIDGFSQWLRDHVTNSDNWGKISFSTPPPSPPPSCIKEGPSICKEAILHAWSYSAWLALVDDNDNDSGLEEQLVQEKK